MGFPRREYMPQSAMAQLNYLAPSHPATHHLPHIIPPCNMPSHLSLYLCTHTPPQLPSTHTTYAYSHYSIPFLTTATSSQSIQWHDYPPSHTCLTKHPHISLKDALEWVAIPFSRGSSWPRDWTQVSLNARQILYHLSHQGNPLSFKLHLNLTWGYNAVLQ